jgi:hypothetical protein
VICVDRLVEPKDIHMRSRTVAIVAGCALAAATLTGCKASTTSATGGATTAPATTATTPATETSTPTDQSSTPDDQSSAPATTSGGGTVDDGLGHPVAVCTLLPVATVAQLSGEALVNAKETDLLPDAKSYGCLYTDSLGTGNVGVSVLAKNAANIFNTGLTFADNHAKPISGVGDKAYSGEVGVSALFGNVEISVTGIQDDDAAVKIIQTLQPQL